MRPWEATTRSRATRRPTRRGRWANCWDCGRVSAFSTWRRLGMARFVPGSYYRLRRCAGRPAVRGDSHRVSACCQGSARRQVLDGRRRRSRIAVSRRFVRCDHPLRCALLSAREALRAESLPARCSNRRENGVHDVVVGARSLSRGTRAREAPGLHGLSRDIG